MSSCLSLAHRRVLDRLDGGPVVALLSQHQLGRGRHRDARPREALSLEDGETTTADDPSASHVLLFHLGDRALNRDLLPGAGEKVEGGTVLL